MKKFILMAFGLLLVIIIPVVVLANVISMPFNAIGDILDLTGDIPVSSSQNDVTRTIANFYKYGYAKQYWDDYCEPKVNEYTRDLKNYYMIPLILAGEADPSQTLIDKMTESMYEVYYEEVEDEVTGEVTQKVYIKTLDPYEYANTIITYPPFSTIGISSQKLGEYIDFFKDAGSSIEYGDGYEQNVPGLSDEYLDEIKDGWGYPFTEFHSVTAHVGLYNPFGEWEQHTGTDFGAPLYTPVYAVKSGEVVSVGDKNCHTDGLMSTACYVNVYSEEEDLYIMYYHFAMPSSLEVGDKVKLGDQVGVVGATGYATGNHLHLEIRKHNASGTVIDYCQLTDCDNPVYADIEGKE